MKEMWNARYSEIGYVYGKSPNVFFKQTLEELDLKPGRILLPAEGEGRNAVYAAKMGWEVDAFDISDAAKTKALALAAEHQVRINYTVGDLSEINYPKASFDVIGLVFAHFPPQIRASYHQKLIELVKPGGYIILEGFSKRQLDFNTKNPSAGGPKDPSLLFSISEIEAEITFVRFLQLSEVEVILSEGKYHEGASSVIRCVAIKQ